jgi:hypothetical protein
MVELIVVAHTNPQALDATLQSIAAQTAPTPVVVARVASGQKSGQNRYAAINQAIARCTSPYVMILHEGDQLADPHVIADCQAHITNHGQPEVLYGERIKYIGPHWYYKKPRRHDQVALGMFVELSCMLIRRDLFQAVSFDPTYREAGDYALVCQLMRTLPQAQWLALDRVTTLVVLDALHEGHLATKLKEDWRVQRHLVRTNLLMCCTVFMTRLVSQLLRKLTRLTLGYPGLQTGPVPLDAQGRVAR